MQQMTINLERSLVQQFPNFMDVVRASIYDCGIPFKNIAAELDYSTSELSRRLSLSDQLPALLQDLPRILNITKDYRPIYWLVENFVDTPEAKHQRAVDQLADLMPKIQSLLDQVKK